MFVLLSVDQVAAVHDYVLDHHELQGLACGRSLKSALARVDNRRHYDLIKDVFALGAAYAAAILQAHCFDDRNKRTAFQEVLDFVLDSNGVQIDWDVETAGQKMILRAQTRMDEDVFAEWLRGLFD